MYAPGKLTVTISFKLSETVTASGDLNRDNVGSNQDSATLVRSEFRSVISEDLMINTHKILLIFLSLAIAALPAAADVLVMKNGDRFTGSVEKLDGKDLVFKSDYAGSIKVPWDAVTSISSAAPVNVGLKDGQMIVGKVATENSKFEIDTKDAGKVEAPRDAVAVIRSHDEQLAYEKAIDRLRNPALTDLWAGFVDLGFSTARGNASTTNLAASAQAARTTSRDKISVYFTSLYATNNTTGDSLETANAMRGGITYNLDLTPRWFMYASADLEHDVFANLDLRFVPAGGLGYHLIKNDRTTLDILGGGALNREFFSESLLSNGTISPAFNRTSGEVMIGNQLLHKFNNVTSLQQKLSFFPNLSSTGEYRLNFDLGLVTTLRKWLSWQASVSDRYISNPAPDRKKNDVLLTTGFRITFAQ